MKIKKSIFIFIPLLFLTSCELQLDPYYEELITYPKTITPEPSAIRRYLVGKTFNVPSYGEVSFLNDSFLSFKATSGADQSVYFYRYTISIGLNNHPKIDYDVGPGGAIVFHLSLINPTTLIREI